MRGTQGREVMREVFLGIAGVVLFILLTGMWACLWVPQF
jgi:hypothetical protein